MKVKVIVQRRSDKKTVMTDFEVFPTVFRVPEFPSEIRIGESIVIKPNINSMPGMDATAAITDENGQVLKQSLGGAPFTFDLANDRNSKFIYLERRIDGKLFGDRYRIEVKKDAPRIPFDPKVTKNYTDITVRTCGTFEGRPNRSKCKISDASNMKVQELYSSYSKAKDSDCYFQTFRFEKKIPINRIPVQPNSLIYLVWKQIPYQLVSEYKIYGRGTFYEECHKFSNFPVE